MGDRANVYIREDAEHGVYFYTHWTGSSLPETVRAALIRGRDRWTDHPYLARIIFNELTKGNEQQITGFGISSRIGDNSYPVLVVDTENMTISYHRESAPDAYDYATDPPHKAFYSEPYGPPIKFEDYIGRVQLWPNRRP